MPQHYQKELHQFFSWCSGYICINYHIRKCAQTMWTVPQHCQQLSTSYLSIFFFSDFLAIFTLITILGNTHSPCKLYLNIINNFTSCLSFFSWFFPDFLIVFTLLTILGNAHRPCLHLLSLHNNLTTKVYIVQKNRVIWTIIGRAT